MEIGSRIRKNKTEIKVFGGIFLKAVTVFNQSAGGNKPYTSQENRFKSEIILFSVDNI